MSKLNRDIKYNFSSYILLSFFTKRIKTECILRSTFGDIGRRRGTTNRGVQCASENMDTVIVTLVTWYAILSRGPEAFQHNSALYVDDNDWGNVDNVSHVVKLTKAVY